MNGDLGLAENGNSLTNPRDEHKLGAAGFVVARSNTDVAKKDFTRDRDSIQELVPVTTASSLNFQSLVVASVTNDSPDRQRSPFTRFQGERPA